jgi:hypothetical protein
MNNRYSSIKNKVVQSLGEHPSSRFIFIVMVWFVALVVVFATASSLGVFPGLAREIRLQAVENGDHASASGAPLLINYQGQLTDASGAPLANAVVDMRFRIYTQATGGSPEWMETHTGVATDGDGRFNVILNSSGAATGDLAVLLRTSGELWLEVEVNNKVLSPRQRVTSAGYALSAPWGGLSGVPADFADGTDNIGLAGTGLSLNSGIYELSARYRLPQACSGGQVAKWNNASLAWECAEDDNDAGIAYTAGKGLLLSGTEFRVNFGLSGSADVAARSDHNHASQSWTAASPVGLEVNNSSAVSGAFALSGVSSGSGDNVGVKGQTSSSAPGAKGVYGYASAPGGAVYGVYGQAASPDGYGLYSQGNASVQGNLGVSGNLNVAGNLNVSGNLNVTGAITFPPKVGYLSIPPAAFMPKSDSATFFLDGDALRTPGESLSGICHNGNDPANWKYFYAPVNLPHNATIVSVELYYYANRPFNPGPFSECNVKSWLLLQRSNFKGAVDNLAEVIIGLAESAPAGSYVQKATTSIQNSVVDNSFYTYYLKVTILPDEAKNKLMGVTIKYTYTSP